VASNAARSLPPLSLSLPPRTIDGDVVYYLEQQPAALTVAALNSSVSYAAAATSAGGQDRDTRTVYGISLLTSDVRNAAFEGEGVFLRITGEQPGNAEGGVASVVTRKVFLRGPFARGVASHFVLKDTEVGERIKRVDIEHDDRGKFERGNDYNGKVKVSVL
jgi:hypothetical protein